MGHWVYFAQKYDYLTYCDSYGLHPSVYSHFKTLANSYEKKCALPI